MRDLTIGKNEAGQRMDKYLKKYFPEAGSGFLYKMLRKKNILLNEKKADGKEMLKQGDRIRLYLAEETIEKFRGGQMRPAVSGRKTPDIKLDVIYEDDHVAIVNKPAGMQMCIRDRHWFLVRKTWRKRKSQLKNCRKIFALSMQEVMKESLFP